MGFFQPLKLKYQFQIGAEIGDQESLGIRHIGQDACPEYVKVETWEYLGPFGWDEDLWMEANCSDGPDPGPTDGPVCIYVFIFCTRT